jgi:hypothetical protein
MKNVVECPRGFFAYFNALETYSVYLIFPEKSKNDKLLFCRKVKCRIILVENNKRIFLNKRRWPLFNIHWICALP